MKAQAKKKNKRLSGKARGSDAQNLKQRANAVSKAQYKKS
jgi:hypothetical protein